MQNIIFLYVVLKSVFIKNEWYFFSFMCFIGMTKSVNFISKSAQIKQNNKCENGKIKVKCKKKNILKKLLIIGNKIY